MRVEVDWMSRLAVPLAFGYPRGPFVWLGEASTLPPGTGFPTRRGTAVKIVGHHLTKSPPFSPARVSSSALFVPHAYMSVHAPHHYASIS